MIGKGILSGAYVFLNRVRDKACFVLLVIGGLNNHLIAGAVFCPKVLSLALCIVRNDLVCNVKNGLR